MFEPLVKRKLQEAEMFSISVMVNVFVRLLWFCPLCTAFCSKFFFYQFHCYFTSESEYFINSFLGKIGFITVVP